MFASNSDLKLLPTIFVLVWPSRVIFLHDLTVLDDALDLGDHERTDTHFDESAMPARS